MSLTKAQLGEVIRSLESGGQTPSNYKIDIREIYLIIDAAFGKVIEKAFFTNKNEGEDIDGSFVTAFPENKVYYSEARDEYFIDLPAKMIKLPGGNDRGLRQVSGVQGQREVFVKLPNGSVGITSPLESSGLLGKIGYYVEGQSVYFADKNKDLSGNYNGKIRGVPNVMVKMIASIDGLDDDDILPIPADMELDLINMVKATLLEQKQTRVDDYNDGANQ